MRGPSHYRLLGALPRPTVILQRQIVIFRYCNSRVVKFDKSGQFIAQFGKFSIEKNQLGGLSLVHDLSIDNKAGEIYIADRENGQVS